ncbi:MAG: aminoacetone oxidase family FAD-binding enzyme, partial [Sedimentisphaerales bacterium]|nr:aminoacetone oxidase family FAD-binding enzyme [Sedimentisphaerales bacterium]
GRCNLTHKGTAKEFVRSYGEFGRFLRPSLYEFCSEDLRRYFSGRGLKTKLEKGGCVFPVSDRASDVAGVLVEHAREVSVRLMFGRSVERIEKAGEGFAVFTGRERVSAQAVIIATGGVSWPFTGSTGDGYEFARGFGHTVVEARAALSPLVTAESWPGELEGVGIREVSIKGKAGGRRVSCSGPLMFTGDGIGGPAVLDFSRLVTDFLPDYDEPLKVSIDLLPGHEAEELDKEIMGFCSSHPKKELAGALSGLVPRAVMEQLCGQLKPSGVILAGGLRKKERKGLVGMLKGLELSIVATSPIAEATVTRGGVSTGQVNPHTMESRLCPGVFFCGEVLNADGPCGGFNLQIAFSTGYAAGRGAGAGMKDGAAI